MFIGSCSIDTWKTMGKSRPRYNEKARASSHLSARARPHPHARDGGKAALATKWRQDTGIAEVDVYSNMVDEILLPKFEEFHGVQQSKRSTSNNDDDEELDSHADDQESMHGSEKSESNTSEINEEDESRRRKVELLNQLNIPLDSKITSKKRKRLEKYVEKQLKNQDRERLLSNLAARRFDSELLRSSRVLGNTKTTAKEDVRQAFLEEKQGIARSNENVKLVETRSNSPSQEANPATVISSNDVPKDISPTVTIVYRTKKSKQSKENENNTSSDTQSIWTSDAQHGETYTMPSIPDGLVLPTDGAMQKPKVIITQRKINGVVVPAVHVPVNRSEDVQVARMALPVVMEEHTIMEAVMSNDVIIISGETGSGKTTQIPQFLYEAGFGSANAMYRGMIGVTQPRKVAAISMAKRVSSEMNLENGEVTYHVRYDKGQTFAGTKIKFMTDGILLRELTAAAEAQSNPNETDDNTRRSLLLLDYSCIIVDEAHERTIGTDTLIGWLTRIVRVRNSGKINGVKPLKLIIMSATLRVEDFSQNKTLFPTKNVPVVKVDGRAHKVVLHFNRVTPKDDYLGEAYNKVCKIHERLPYGGILVFVTGRKEVTYLVNKLRETYPSKEHLYDDSANEKLSKSKDMKSRLLETNELEEAENDDLDDLVYKQIDTRDTVDDYVEGEDEDGEELRVLNNGAQDNDDIVDLDTYATSAMASEERNTQPLWVLPLYSLLSHEDQLKVFQPPPPGHRLVIVATNVAEASITIPNIKYVVDTGKVKEKTFNPVTRVESFRINWISKASADQRAGRAGRTGPGHCYRLYSSAIFDNTFIQHSIPEILRTPLESLVLRMKAVGINQVVSFPFPTPPDRYALQKAEQLLVHLGALVDAPTAEERVITPIGTLMSRFAISPRFAKIIVMAVKFNDAYILDYCLTISACSSVGELFLTDAEKNPNAEDAEHLSKVEKQEASERRRKYYSVMSQYIASSSVESDHFTVLEAFRHYLSAATDPNIDLPSFCENHFLRMKAMDEVMKLRKQLIQNCDMTFMTTQAKKILGLPKTAKLSINAKIPFPSPSIETRTTLRRLILEGFIDNIAQLNVSETEKFLKIAQKTGSGLRMGVYSTLTSKDERYVLGQQSALRGVFPHCPWIIYNDVASRETNITLDTFNETKMAQRRIINPTETYYLRMATVVDPKWFVDCLPRSLCRLGGVLDKPQPYFDEQTKKIMGYKVPTLGPKSWTLPAIKCEVEEKNLPIRERLMLKKSGKI